MPSELRPVAQAFGLRRDVLGDLPVHTAAHGEDTFVATMTGIGTERASTAAEVLLESAEVDHVLVVGIAGGIGPVAVRDLVVPEVVTDWPATRELRATPLPGAEPSGRLVTSDEYGYAPEVVAGFVDQGVLAVDMETAAIAAVCEERDRPWTAFRAISDRADDDTVDDAVITLAKPDGSPDLGASLRYVARRPWRLPALARLAKDATAAAKAAAEAAARACGVSAGT